MFWLNIHVMGLLYNDNIFMQNCLQKFQKLTENFRFGTKNLVNYAAA